MHIHPAMLVFLAIGLLASVATADTSTRAGGYSIQHNAMTTDMLDPEVAKANGILRSKFRGMLNVTVIKGRDGQGEQSIPARVEVSVGEPDKPASRLPMREINLGGDVSYIGEFQVKDLQILDFNIKVTPEKSVETYGIDLQQQFFID